MTMNSAWSPLDRYVLTTDVETPSAIRETDEGESRASLSALAYAEALKRGDTEEVIGRTRWMQDRLKRVLLETGDSDAVEEARSKLADKLTDRRLEGNQLRPEGVEDQYVFPPDCALRLAGEGVGPEGLAGRAEAMVWIEVTYPTQERALLDESGAPIRSLLAGVALSAEGDVLKAGVVGNMQIDRDKIGYDWPVTGG